ncbi:F0F1 ATP synthase subunit alpha, partial [Streptomyces caeruleatus]
MHDADALYGLVLNLEEDAVKVVVLGDVSRVKEGMTVLSTGRILSIPVSDMITGRVLSALAEPVDGKGALLNPKFVPIERQ